MYKDKKQQAKTGVQEIYKKSRSKFSVINDENYLISDKFDVSISQYFYARTCIEVKCDERTIPKAK